jgi:hypothetical protein
MKLWVPKKVGSFLNSFCFLWKYLLHQVNILFSFVIFKIKNRGEGTSYIKELSIFIEV